MNKLKYLFLTLFFFPLSIYAHIAGTYQVSGFDPRTEQNYTGLVIISKTENVYIANWVFSDGTFDVGTGVKKENSIAFVFNENGSKSFGDQEYKIEGTVLSGPWTIFNGKFQGSETLIMITQ